MGIKDGVKKQEGRKYAKIQIQAVILSHCNGKDNGRFTIIKR